MNKEGRVDLAMKGAVPALLIVVAVLAGVSGCGAVRRIFVKPPPEGITQESEAVAITGYQSTVIIKATPQELVDRILKDFTWVEKASDSLKVEVTDIRPGTDMTVPGQSVGVKIKLLGISMASRFITVRYKPERELWVLVVAENNWLLCRAKVSGVSEGSKLTLSLIGEPSKSLSAIMDTNQFRDAVAGRMDMILAHIQSEFDPEVNVEEVTRMGLRGEIFGKFIQTMAVTVWVDAAPRDVMAWGSQPENIAKFGKEFKVEEQYLVEFQQAPLDEVTYMPADFQSGILRSKSEVFVIKRKTSKGYITRLYMTLFNNFGYIDILADAASGGSNVTCKVVAELPGSGSGENINEMLLMAGIPNMLRDRAIIVKNGVEGRE